VKGWHWGIRGGCPIFFSKKEKNVTNGTARHGTARHSGGVHFLKTVKAFSPTMGNTTTLQFETPESLIEELFKILRSLATPDQLVYMNIISDDDRDGVHWHYSPSELTEENRGIIMDHLTDWLPWPKKSNGHSTVTVDGNTNRITVTLT
jgi:hypothetical protein